MPDAPLRIEASGLRGRTFTCLPGCGFCCLCQPGLTAEERGRFGGPLARAVDKDGDALRIVGQAGPCALLSAERTCTQYDLRPRGCRSFPFHTTFTWRAQATVNRGCPGTWAAGAPPAAATYDPQEMLPPAGEAADAARAGEAAWAQFRAQAKAAGVDASPEDVRRQLLACLPHLLDAEGLAAGLALAESGDPVTPRRIAQGRGLGKAALHQFLEEQARATFGQKEPKRLPIFVDAERTFAWHAFRLRGDAIERCVIEAGGALRPEARVPLAPLPLLPRDAAAEALFAEHARTIADRDLLVGLAAFMLDRLGYGEPFASAALRELCAALGDLGVRAGLLARFEGRETVDERAMARGVAFFDMDFLNSPTLGVAF